MRQREPAAGVSWRAAGRKLTWEFRRGIKYLPAPPALQGAHAMIESKKEDSP